MAELLDLPPDHDRLAGAGMQRVANVRVLVLETDGSMSVIGTVHDDSSALNDVRGRRSSDATAPEAPHSPERREP